MLCLPRQLQALRAALKRILEVRFRLKGEGHIWDHLLLEQFLPASLRRAFVIQGEKTQIVLHLRIFRDNVGNRSAANQTWIDGQTWTPALELLKLPNLMGQFDNGISSLLRLNTCVGGAPVSGKYV